MTKKPVTVQIATGLEARPIAIMVQVASKYTSDIYVEVENKKINAKSIMGMMTLGLNAGEEIIISAEGEDEEEAVKGIEEFLSQN